MNGTRIYTGPQPLTSQERNRIYLEVVTGLMGVKVDNKNYLWDLSDPAMKRFRVMMKLYLDYGKEFSGELDIESIGRKLIYTLYNDRSKKTVAYLSQDKYIKAKQAKEKQLERKTNQTQSD